VPEVSDLQNQVDLAIRNLKKDHEEAVKTVAFLKKRIDDLELHISKEGYVRTDADAGKLNSAMEQLDRFIDSLILNSARVKEKCERLAQECQIRSFEPVGLESLRALCHENEQLAKDLLCYSLGRFKRASLAEVDSMGSV